MSKTIAVITGSRAEYGLLESVLDAIDAHDELELRLLVTGTHLITESKRDIRFPIAARVRMQRVGGLATRAEDVQSLSRGVAGLGRVLSQLGPDVVLVLGDRIEALAGALAAQVGGLRLAHVHGGDRAEGVADEAMRHAISKLAHLHFPATSQSKQRLIRMGEDKGLVFRVGSPAVDGLKRVKPIDDAPDLVVMQHPTGATPDEEYHRMQATLDATAPHSRLVLAPNHDPGRNAIVRAIVDAKLTPTDHLPRAAFLALLAGTKALVGNSSAGLIEAAVLRTPAVNIGQRQAGREQPKTVVNADHDAKSIEHAIAKALTMKTKGLRHPYGGGKSGQAIADRLATIDLATVPLHKRNAY
ncbi:MAG: UDP-N-acetylglucosamine 2-epimerase [Phycisphaeraceae bacterium]